MADEDGTGGSPISYTQNVTVASGFAYGVIGADIHVFSNGLPLYLLANWPGVLTADHGWLRELPSRMLNASRAVTPFTGRDGELADLRQWRDDGPRFSALWLHGPGGQGKTRLAAQLAAESAAVGWRVVAVFHGPDADRPEPGSQDVTLEGAAGLLLIVDYADRWLLTNLTWLLKNTLLHQDGVPTRILMLARSLDGWPAVSAALDRYQAGTFARFLPELDGSSGERENMFRVARDSFAVIYGLPGGASLEPPATLSDPEFGLTLAVQMAALVAVDAGVSGDSPPAGVEALTAYLLNREVLHWSRLYAGDVAGTSGGTGQFRTPPNVMSRAVFAASLIGTVPSAEGLTVLSGLRLPSPRIVLNEHARCYPPTMVGQGMVLEPLYPDRLAEDFLALTLDGHSAQYQPQPWGGETIGLLLNRPGKRAEPRAWTPRAITFLASAAQRWPHVGPRYLFPLLAADPWLGVAAGGAALTALSQIGDLDLAILDAIDDRLPKRDVNLDAGMAALARRLADHKLAAAPDEGARAEVYLHLGFRYSHAGLVDEALAVTQTAVGLCRRVAQANPADAEDARRLAMSVGNLGSILSDAGRWEEAVVADEEAVAIQRRIVAANPTFRLRPSKVRMGIADQLFLAGTLTNLAVDYSHLGRPRDAVDVMEKTVGLLRIVRWGERYAGDGGLAHALDQLGNQLAAVGRPDDGMAASREAVKIYRRLVETSPGTHEHSLAGALNNLSIQLLDIDEIPEAIATADEAVAILRRLVKASPGALSGELAQAISQYGGAVWRSGRTEEGLTVLEEAVARYRKLAAADPLAHEVSLALTLSNMTSVLLYLARPTDALARSTEAVDILRRHADSAATQKPLHDALFNTGLNLTFLGETARAQESFLEASRLARRLAASIPAFTESDPYARLVGCSESLAALGRHEDALSVTRNTAALYEGLAAADPGDEPTLARAQYRLAHSLLVSHQAAEALGPLREAARLLRPRASTDLADRDILARSLAALGIALAATGHSAEALDQVTESVGHYRILTEASRTRYSPSLAGALDVLGAQLERLGRTQEASAGRDEAAAIRSSLSDQPPT